MIFNDDDDAVWIQKYTAGKFNLTRPNTRAKLGWPSSNWIIVIRNITHFTFGPRGIRS